MSEWVETTLGEVLVLTKRTVDVADLDEVPWAGARWYAEGIYARPIEAAARVKTKTLNRLEIDDITYNRMWATKAAFGVVDGDASGCLVTGDFPVFVANQTRLLPAYVRAIFKSEQFQNEASVRAVGTTERRRLKEPDFLDISITLPPLPEQRRIVDVMAAVDAQIEALAEEVGKARKVLDCATSDRIAALPSKRSLGQFTTTRSGPSYAATDVTRDPRSGGVPSIGIPNTKPDGSIDLAEIGYVNGLPMSVATVDANSLVLIRTNGNRQRIGNVYLPPATAEGHVVSAFQFLMKVADDVDREFVFWVLRESGMQAAMSNAASGTTGLGNLAVKWLNSAQVHWSGDPSERARAVAPLRAQQDNIDCLAAELAQLRGLRSALLTALLNQDVEIPESYDALLEAVS